MPWLARTLDWPFHGLGRYVEIARMEGAAGEFFNVTWPGYVGVLTALAPDRFGASINQAPLRRRTHQRFLRPFDLAVNGLSTLIRQRSIPPDQLLRFVFEEAGDYAEARRMLEMTPIARPAIFTLVGCHRGERCVIERTEDDFETRTDDHGAANDWLETRPQWEGRISANQVLSCTFEQAAEKSRARRRGAGVVAGRVRDARASAGSRRRCSIPTRGSRSRCAPRAACCARWATSRLRRRNCRSPRRCRAK